MYTIVGSIKGTSNVLIASQDGSINIKDFNALDESQLSILSNVVDGKIQNIQKLPVYSTEGKILKNASLIIICKNPIRVMDAVRRVYTLSDSQYKEWRKKFAFYDYEEIHKDTFTDRLVKAKNNGTLKRGSVISASASRPDVVLCERGKDLPIDAMEKAKFYSCYEDLHIVNAVTHDAVYGGRHYRETIEDITVKLEKCDDINCIQVCYIPREYKDNENYRHTDTVEYFLNFLKLSYKDNPESFDCIQRGLLASKNRITAKACAYGFNLK